VLNLLQETEDSTSRAVSDVLIKLIRVIANLSISEELGCKLADDQRCVEFLLHIIGKDLEISGTEISGTEISGTEISGTDLCKFCLLRSSPMVLVFNVCLCGFAQ